ncbi:MAG: hypothetical protein ACERKO_07495 [Acetanaerobacterium sp.]
MKRFLSMGIAIIVLASLPACSTSLPRVKGDASSDAPQDGAAAAVVSNTFELPSATPLRARWSGDSTALVVQDGSSLVHIGVLDQTNTVDFSGDGTDMGYSDISLSWNDEMVFAAATNGTPTRVVEQNGRLTLVNAAIYTAYGQLIHVFPEMPMTDIKPTIETFERSVSQDVTEVTWLDNDRFAVNTRARVYIYSVSHDELTLVSDMIDYVRKGWTISAASSFGAGQGWADGGRYYYTACLVLNDDQTQRELLYVVDGDNPGTPVFASEELPAHPRYQVENGIVLVFDDYLNEEETGWRTRIQFADTADRVLHPVMDVATGQGILSDGRYIYGLNYDEGFDESGQFIMIDSEFYCCDTTTGETVSVLRDELSLPKPRGQYYCTPLSLDASDPDDLRLVFVANDSWEDPVEPRIYQQSSLYSYTMGSKKLVEIMKISDDTLSFDVFDNIISPSGTYIYGRGLRFDDVRQSDFWTLSIIPLA